LALNLVPCFTPVESPESNGMAEAFEKTFKRDYVRVSLIPTVALALIDSWMEDYNTVHPHSRLTPGEYPFPTRCVSSLMGSTPSRRHAARDPTHALVRRPKPLVSR